jgi:hypothetical protein
MNDIDSIQVLSSLDLEGTTVTTAEGVQMAMVKLRFHVQIQGGPQHLQVMPLPAIWTTPDGARGIAEALQVRLGGAAVAQATHSPGSAAH